MPPPRSPRVRPVVVAAAAVVCLGGILAIVAAWKLADQARRGNEVADDPNAVFDPDAKFIYLNITPEGHVTLAPLEVIDQETLTNLAQVQTYMKRRYDEDMRSARPDERDKAPRYIVILRADPQTPIEAIEAIKKVCVEAGYPPEQIQTQVGG